MGVAFIAGCTPAPEASPTDTPQASESAPAPISEADTDDASAFQGFAGFQSEYRGGVSELRDALPDGADFPEQPPGDWEAEGNYQSGLGYMTAAFVVQCAWMTEWERGRQASDERLMTTALDELDKWVRIPGVSQRLDQEYVDVWLKDVLGAARSGQPDFLEALAADC